jgi:hypothetical protein
MRSPSRLSFAQTSSESIPDSPSSRSASTRPIPGTDSSSAKNPFHHAIDPASPCRHQGSQRRRQMVSNSGGLAPCSRQISVRCLLKCPTPIAGRWCAWNRKVLPLGFQEACYLLYVVGNSGVLHNLDQRLDRRFKSENFGLGRLPTRDRRKSAYDALPPRVVKRKGHGTRLKSKAECRDCEESWTTRTSSQPTGTANSAATACGSTTCR